MTYKIFRRICGLKEPNLLILDSAAFHKTEKITSYLKNQCHPLLIPGGLTPYLQPLDISINKVFK